MKLKIILPTILLLESKLSIAMIPITPITNYVEENVNHTTIFAIASIMMMVFALSSFLSDKE
jgi:NADH:ubiquinone oxidoreductase subunit H